jgi:hypothetical protein
LLELFFAQNPGERDEQFLKMEEKKRTKRPQNHYKTLSLPKYQTSTMKTQRGMGVDFLWKSLKEIRTTKLEGFRNFKGAQ